MPVSGPVYQPTTVTYQQQPHSSRWDCPMSYFSQRVTNNLNKPKCLKLTLCIVGIVIFITGLAMVIGGSVRYSDSSTDATLVNSTATIESHPNDESEHGRLGVVVTGSILLIIGALFAGCFAFSLRSGSRSGGNAAAGGGSWLSWRHGAASASSGAPLGPVPAACPSTDPLVHAAQPTANDDERRNLMDNKDCLSSAEESDKMLDPEPQVIIVSGA